MSMMMKKERSSGPDGLPIEVFKALGKEGEMWIKEVQQALRNDIPNEWRKTVIAPIYKQNGETLN